MGIETVRKDVGHIELSRTVIDKTSLTLRVTSDELNNKTECGYAGYVPVTCHWSNPLEVGTYADEFISTVDVKRKRLSTFDHPGLTTEFLDYIVEIKAALDEFFTPETNAEGLWWADENYYPIRPLLEGEDPDVKPAKGITVVDGDGNVVSESVSITRHTGKIVKTMKKTIKLTESRLRQVIREELLRQKLGVLYEDAALGGLLHKAVTHLWQADNVLGQAVQQADQDHHDLVAQLKAAVEKMAFDVETKATSTSRGDVKSSPKAPPPPPSSRKP